MPRPTTWRKTKYYIITALLKDCISCIPNHSPRSKPKDYMCSIVIQLEYNHGLWFTVHPYRIQISAFVLCLISLNLFQRLQTDLKAIIVVRLVTVLDSGVDSERKLFESVATQIYYPTWKASLIIYYLSNWHSGSRRASETHQILHRLECSLDILCQLINPLRMDSIQLALGENCGTLFVQCEWMRVFAFSACKLTCDHWGQLRSRSILFQYACYPKLRRHQQWSYHLQWVFENPACHSLQAK